MRKSSRSVCTNLLEAFRKKRYPLHFVSKVTDADGENSETGGWLGFSVACKYLDHTAYQRLHLKSNEVGRLLNHMINNPEKY
jgi:four helix bundle protein